MIITSVNNEKIKDLTKLQEKKYRDEAGLFLVEGEHLVEEAYKAQSLKEILVLEDFEFDLYVPKITVSSSVMKKLSKQVTMPNIIGVAIKKKESPITGNVLILDAIQDPGNLGTIIRSAAAFNIQTIILSPDSVDVYNEKVVRSTQGLIFKMNIVIKDLVQAIEQLKKNNYFIIASSVIEGDEYMIIEDKFALIVGNEGRGVSNELIELADDTFKIDMAKNVESLNVGVAASIILYELNKR